MTSNPALDTKFKNFISDFRNLSQSSSDTGFFGSMEKEKRRKKLDGRVDAETIINELMEGVDLDKAAHEDAESKEDIFGLFEGGGKKPE